MYTRCVWVEISALYLLTAEKKEILIQSEYIIYLTDNDKEFLTNDP